LASGALVELKRRHGREFPAVHFTPKTIQAYHGRIKDKLRLSDANELMREAICWIKRAGKRNRRTTRQPDDPEITAAGDMTMLPPGY
jgi:hypothetical protein